MKIARHNIFLFFAILSAAIGSWFFYDWWIEKVNLFLCLSNLIPSAIFFIIYVLEKKYGSKKKIQSVSHIIILFIIVPCLLFLYFTNSFIPVEYGIRNLRKYSSILNNNWGNNLVHHFPRKIPDNAKNVKFFYRMGYLQGGSRIQLSYTTTPEEINKLYDRFSKIKTKSLNDKSSKDYETMSFDWVPSEKERKRRGIPINNHPNHGRSHGVSINKKQNLIVYWAKTW